MLSRALRLNEVIEDFHSYIDSQNETDIKLAKTLYSYYAYSYINADSKEEFIYLFLRTWNREIDRFRVLVEKQLTMLEKLDFHRDEIFSSNRDGSTTESGSIKEELEHGKKITHGGKDTNTDTYGVIITDSSNSSGNNSGLDYDVQVQSGSTSNTSSSTNNKTGTIKTDKEHGKTETNSGTDTNTKTFENYKNENTEELSHNTTVKSYDIDKFIRAMRTVNIYDLWLDAFDSLFNGILFVQ